MSMIDPLNTTARDGAACGLCGDDAAGVSRVELDGSVQEIPTCSACYHDQITTCAQCDKGILQVQAVRVGTALWCARCAKQDAAVTHAYMREHARDVTRDEFDQVRR
jgi:hypothetical protein